MTWRVYARYQDFSDNVEIAVSFTDPHGKRSFVEPPLVFREREGFIPPEDVDLARNIDGMAFLQAFLDAAWDLGLRPKGFEDHKNELTAVRYHLEDMRKLAKVRG